MTDVGKRLAGAGGSDLFDTLVVVENYPLPAAAASDPAPPPTGDSDDAGDLSCELPEWDFTAAPPPWWPCPAVLP